MIKQFSLAGALTGLLLGALVGAIIFALSGNLDLSMGFLSMLIFALISGLIGSQLAPMLKAWLDQGDGRLSGSRPLTEISERVKLEDEESPHHYVRSKEFPLDTRRLAGLFLLFTLIAISFGYLHLNFGSGFLFFASFFLIPSFYYLMRLIRNRGLNVQISQNGFSYNSSQQRFFISWDEIDKVYEKKQKYSWNFIPVWNIHNLKITIGDGKTIALSRILSRFKELADIIQSAVTEHQLPDALEEIANGGALDFDEFILTHQGIQHKEQFLPWHEVEKIMIYQARVQVRRTGKNWFNWAETKAWNIANFPQFVIIASRYSRVE